MKKFSIFIVFFIFLFCSFGYTQETADVSMQQYQMNFTGKWDPTHDSLILAERDYSDIQNMRYKDRGMEGVSGYSKINTTALTTYLKIKNGFHFVREEPAESHVLVQAYNSGETASQILQNTTAIPDQGDFSATALHTDASGAGKGRFDYGPQGTVFYSNGEESLVWGGDESPCYSFINYATDGSFSYDYSEQITNTLTDSGNIATLYTGSAPGLDSDVMLLLHLDNNVTDSSPTTPHTVTDVGSNLTYSSSDKVFGTHSAVFDGTSAYMTIPDDADFSFTGGYFTIDTWVKIDSLAADRIIYYQETAGTGNDWFKSWITTDGSVYLSVCRDLAGSPDYVVQVYTASGLITTDTWHHIELAESGNGWYIFVDGIQRSYVGSAGRAANYTGLIQIGYDGSTYFSGKMDEFRVSDVARHTADFETPAGAYSTSTTECVFYIGGTRPLNGFKPYVQTPNTSASTMTVQEWGETGWSSVSSLSDGTSSGGISLAQDGSVTFDSTVTTAKVKYINGSSLYFYRVHVSAVSSGTQLYYVTLSAPFQAITNVWSGDYGVTASCKKYDTTTYHDYTLHVNSADTTLYANLSSLASTHYVVLGFTKPQQGFDIEIPGGKGNTDGAVMSVYYWDGAAWIVFPYFSDGTNVNSASLSQSGTVSFTPVDRNSEKTTTIDGMGPYYYYKIAFNSTLDAEVFVYYISGIEAPDDLLPYELPVYFQNRILLCSRNGDLSEVRISKSNNPNVFNGSDSTILNLGGASKFVAGKGLYNKLGSTLYDLAILCKISETWVLDGYAVSGTGQFTTKKASDTIGCIAPLTMTVCEVGYISNQQTQRNVAIWLAHGGIYLFDGSVLKKINGIEPYFDTTDSRCINYSSADASFGFFDAENQEYNLLIPSGSGQTTCNTWLIYDMMRDRWTKKVPPTYPQSGFTVRATHGERHNYLGLDTGYLLRNEYGNNFDGADIDQFVVTSDILPTASLFEEIRLDYMKFICKAKNTGDEDSISIYHRSDADTTWTALTSVPMYATGKRIVQHNQRLNKIGIGHELKFQVSTNDKDNGFEPVALGMLYHPERLDLTLGVRN